ncbi:tRNA (adenosine(37)-N6)-threonylcarbamoyltransferase complex dimerization subunit type 1 TsaB [Antarcticimicrobium luteum]|uniref:tRNA (Adenosine(37)-N6)-threonylcarbamoyltransferase complex dimerization subunit type 1 TsaB n=1 Tax=Antarcticimicrobium luteum TaxID=2547397 RepID=A0A4R5UT18_9RHOB|nr:tRNA (adenosine(37)-N6)-threonylcarbamoyltransferase complex dimerization subunit type 1 TsaB [Antarcticimicrobium luteum]TDK42262.1 tRNA (adenosine(37)-N6)-threonylcarbamoyltransferase complex dimerization subunit type 1 TsaB [Antarcticimicrobium luteum]
MAQDPLILSFDTSAAHCAAALLSGGKILVTRGEDMGRGQAERLFPLLEELLTEAGAHWADLSAIGVGVGPGNFTGIRIAVSAARGLALALPAPAIGVSTFEALREGARAPVLTAVAAPRGAVYLQAPGGAPLGPVQPEDLPEDLREDLRDSGLDVIGAEAEALARLTGGRALSPAHPLAEAIARIAARRIGTDIAPPRPLYIRAADAAPSREAPPVLLD